MSLLSSVQKVYLLLGQDTPSSLDEDEEDENLQAIFLEENRNLLAAYNWRFATISTKLYPSTDDEIKAIGLFDAKTRIINITNIQN